VNTKSIRFLISKMREVMEVPSLSHESGIEEERSARHQTS
jgi:hypothetical protein